MAPPANTTFGTAVNISSLPYDFTQTDINDAGTNYTVYYRFIAPSNSRVIGAWGFSGNIGAGYQPTLRVYNGPVGSPTQVTAAAGQNIPIQVPVVAGQEYFLEFTKNVNSAGPESLRIRAEVAPLNSPAVGNIIVNDDTDGYPLCILSHLADNTVINFVDNMPSGEAGDILASGVMALEDTASIHIFNSIFGSIVNVAYAPGTIRVRACRATERFWCGLSNNPSTVVVNSLTPTGVLGSTHTLTGNTLLESLAANNAETILYHAAVGFGVPVKRWDLTNNVQLSDLAALVANYQIPDILNLADDTVVALYYNSSTKDVQAKHYSAAGATLNTYSLGAQTGTTKPRMAYALDNPNSFWIWTHSSSGGLGGSIFRNVKVSDGSILTTRLQQEYEGGAYNGPQTATPAARFGNSFSCPFFIYPGSLVSGDLSGLYYINANKATKRDGYYTADKKIPDPTIRTALIGE